MTIIAICSTHVLKFFGDKIKFDKKKKSTIIDIFSTLVLSDNYRIYLERFAYLYSILKSEKLPADILNSIDIKNSIDHQFDDGSVEENYEENDDFLVKNSLYLQNNFAADARNACDNLLRSFSENSQVSNYYHDQDLANYLARKMSRFAPLWSSFIHN